MICIVAMFFFLQGRSKKEPYFLETSDGAPYADVFRGLRFNHMINHHMDMEMLLSGGS